MTMQHSRNKKVRSTAPDPVPDQPCLASIERSRCRPLFHAYRCSNNSSSQSEAVATCAARSSRQRAAAAPEQEATQGCRQVPLEYRVVFASEQHGLPRQTDRARCALTFDLSAADNLDMSAYQTRYVALEVAYLGERYHGLASQANTEQTIEVLNPLYSLASKALLTVSVHQPVHVTAAQGAAAYSPQLTQLHKERTSWHGCSCLRRFR